MAQQVRTVLVDDLDGSAANESVHFALDGSHFEVDLNTRNAKELRSLLKPYLRAARSVAPPKPALEVPKVRKWAWENGYELANRGRIPHEIIEAYRAARK